MSMAKPRAILSGVFIATGAKRWAILAHVILRTDIHGPTFQNVFNCTCLCIEGRAKLHLHKDPLEE